MNPKDYSHLEVMVAKDILGLNLCELKFTSLGIEPSELLSRSSNMSVFEIGLSEVFACLMVQLLRKSNVPKDAYFLSKRMDCLTPLYATGESYCLSYDKRAVCAVEEAIRLADSLTAVISGIKYAQDKTNQAKSLLKFEQVQRIAEQRAKRNVRRRIKMWKEIDKGLDLLLSDRNNPNNPFPNNSVVSHRIQFPSEENDSTWNLNFLHLHGDELREWVRQPQLFRLPEEIQVVLIGHYHLQMATIRHGLWIVFCGCFVKVLSGKYILSHVGTPIIEICPVTHLLKFVIDRSAGLASST